MKCFPGNIIKKVYIRNHKLKRDFIKIRVPIIINTVNEIRVLKTGNFYLFGLVLFTVMSPSKNSNNVLTKMRANTTTKRICFYASSQVNAIVRVSAKVQNQFFLMFFKLLNKKIAKKIFL